MSPQQTAPTAPADADAPPAAPPKRSAVGLLLRFISCGLLALALGVLWRFTLAPKQIHAASALAGILFLLFGFIAGGLLWYLRDARLRARHPELVDDERLVFSFVVFALMPLAVLVVVALVWILALVIGGA
jgi:hypothetical protein